MILLQNAHVVVYVLIFCLGFSPKSLLSRSTPARDRGISCGLTALKEVEVPAIEVMDLRVYQRRVGSKTSPLEVGLTSNLWSATTVEIIVMLGWWCLSIESRRR